MSSSTSSSETSPGPLIRRGIVLVAWVLVLLALAFVFLPTSPRKYLASLADKDALLRRADAPKLVAVGGSNLAFGLDSSLLEASLDYDVVNMGLHSGLGLRYMLGHVEPHLAPGDVVVLAMEYRLMNGLDSNRGLPEALAEFPGGLRYLRPADHMQLDTFLLAFQRRAQHSFGFVREQGGPVFRRGGFDHNGDLISHLGEANREFQKSYETFERPPAATAMARLNAFHERALRRGAKVMLSFPSFPEEYVAPEGAAWMATLRRSLQVPIISEPTDYFFPKRQFFDSCYHLNADGRQRRSKLLLRDLQAAGVGRPPAVDGIRPMQ